MVVRFSFMHTLSFKQVTSCTFLNGADSKVEVANFCAVIDTLVDQDGGSKHLCSDGHLGISRWGPLNILGVKLLWKLKKKSFENFTSYLYTRLKHNHWFGSVCASLVKEEKSRFFYWKKMAQRKRGGTFQKRGGIGGKDKSEEASASSE